MAWRLAAPALAVATVLLWAGGAGGAASLLLLLAIAAGAVRLLETVGRTADGRCGRFAVAAAAAGLVSLVAAGTTHVPLLALGLLACAAAEPLGEVEAGAELPADPVELRRAA